MASKQELEELEEYDKYLNEWKLLFYSPYEKQIEFHTAGATFRERLFMAGNQLGKTLAGAAECAMHLTGIYPDWWRGRRLKSPNKWWVSGETGESTRDNPQRLLMGEIGQWGSGMIPKPYIGKYSMARGTADLIDHVQIKHSKGGWSHLFFKTYGKGREKWQGETLTGGLWFDEEPPADVYSEGLTRTNTKLATVIVTFTPLKGMSEVVSRFLVPDETDEGSKNRTVIQMTIDDVKHYSEKQKKTITDQYPDHEREARAKGTPMLGSGRVFTVPEHQLQESVKPQDSWMRIIGMDFGWGDHPTAGVLCAIDRQNDCFHVLDIYRSKDGIPAIHAAALKTWGFIPVAWPHDGLMHDKSSGKQIAQLYRDQGLNMLYEFAQFPDDRGFGVEAGVTEMLQRMQTGRFKVASHLSEWFEEYRLYHRKDGKISPVKDDLISATRYAMMCQRFATVMSFRNNYNSKIEYPNIGIV